MPLQIQHSRFLSEFSTFGIGGPIRAFVEVRAFDEMREAFSLQMPTLVIGKGSNCLFSDRGFDGLVILNKIDFCNWHENEVYVGAGYSFSLLGVQSARKNFSGLEFASGIPASVGGAVFMNAGANGGETKDCLKAVHYMHANGEIVQTSKAEMVFGYRTSSFQSQNGAILAATFALNSNPESRQTQLGIIDYRMKTQPLKEKSAGCVFRNPKDGSAGKLIDQCGLKGTAVGGALISEMHGNFIINKGDATSENVCQLIALVQQRVLEQTGVHLETEIRIFP